MVSNHQSSTLLYTGTQRIDEIMLVQDAHKTAMSRRRLHTKPFNVLAHLSH